MSFVEARNRAITEAMTADERIIMIGTFVGPGEPEGGYGKTFGRRVRGDLPISEEGFGGAAVGAAIAGLRPLVAFSNVSFMYDAWEPILNEAAFMRYMSGGQITAPVVFHATIGLRPGWAAQHAQNAQGMLCNAPGLVVLAPGTPSAAYACMAAALRGDDPIVYLDTPAIFSEVGEVPDAGGSLQIRADIVRMGHDVTVVAVGGMVSRALRVAERLAGERISVEVVDPRVLAPLDRQGIVESVSRTGRLVAVDEGPLTCGVASEIVASVAEAGFGRLKAAPQRVAVPDVPSPNGPTMYEVVTPTEARIEAAIRRVLA
jgi:acetoin:2,6-dichlorophenolindophenol oxidoreductase subunit beta